MSSPVSLTAALVRKLWIAVSVIVLLLALVYVGITNYYSTQYHLALAQRVNAPLASHLIEEKFQEASPFLEDGSVNKPLFGSLMHDMMAVNRAIEVYLLGESGEVLYSVVLSHDAGEPTKKVPTEPIQRFLETQGEELITGVDPRNPEEDKIFSAAEYNVDGKKGYVYIILAGEELAAASSALVNTYGGRLGGASLLIATLFGVLLGVGLIWFITSNLRSMVEVVNRFRKGDMKARITNPERSDVAPFALAFNSMAETIEENIEKVQGVDRLRRELIANVSHDLRTPIAVLQGYVELLEDKDSSITEEDRKQYVSILHSNAQRLGSLVDQLFEYSKLEAHQIQPVFEPFSISDMGMDLVSKYQVIAKRKNISVRVDAKEDVNAVVYADIGLVERALQNLIDNAIKFTPEGGEVVFCIKPKEKHFAISIKDSGAGVPEEHRVHLFERFYQMDRAEKRQGAGLGLAIVKKIMDLHNTSIRILTNDSQEQGTIFTFDLPVAG